MVKSLLIELAADRRLVDLRREYVDLQDTRGRVIQLSEVMVLIELITDDVRPNGFCVLRIEDITFLRWGTRAHLAWEQALAQLPAQEEPRLGLESPRDAIRSLSRRKELVTFRRETVERDNYYLGWNLALRGELVTFEHVTIDGDLDGRVAMSLNEITRLDFGGSYEKSLQRIAKLSDLETSRN